LGARKYEKLKLKLKSAAFTQNCGPLADRNLRISAAVFIPGLLLLLLLLRAASIMDSRQETMCHSILLALGVAGSASGAETSDWRLR